MKKGIVIACLSLCLAAMTACGNNNAPEESETEITTTTLPVNVAEKWFEEVTTAPVTEAPIEITTEPVTTTPPPETTTEPTTTEETTTTTIQTVVETVPTTAPAPVIITQPPVTQPPKTIYVYETVTAPTQPPQTVYVTVPVPAEPAPVMPDIHELVPHSELNVSDNEKLYEFEMSSNYGGDFVFDIRGLTVSTILDETMLKPFTFDNSLTIEENVDRDYFFEAPLFGPEVIKEKSMKISDVFDGSLFAVESVDRNGDIILNEKFGKLNEKQYDNCYVKAIHVARFMNKNDMDFAFYKGLRLGMSEDEFYRSVSNQRVSANDTVILKNNDNTLLVKFAWVGAATTETSVEWRKYSKNADIRVVDEITLFNNDGLDLEELSNDNLVAEGTLSNKNDDEDYAPWYTEPDYTETTAATTKQYSWVDDAYRRQFGYGGYYNNGYGYNYYY